MLALQKILLPADFFEGSVGAARQAAALARHFHSEIVLLHVQAALNYRLGALEYGFLDSPGGPPAEIAGRAQKELESFLDAELTGISVGRILLEGDPALKIVEFARSQQVSLIVMSTHGWGAFRRFLLGSVTAKVLHDAECPVWTGVHLEKPPADSFSIRNILCAVDLSPHSHTTLRWATQMASEFGANLRLVHVTPPVEEGEWRDVLFGRVAAEIAQLQTSLGTRAEVSIKAGDVAKATRRVAEEVHADLLVIGRSPGTMVAGRLHADAYALIRESPCPVVSV